MSPRTAGEKRASERKIHRSMESSLWVSSRVLIGAWMGGNYQRLRKEFPERIEQMVPDTHIGLGTGTLHNSWGIG